MSVAFHCKIWLAAIPLAAVVPVIPAQDELSIKVEVDLVSVLCSVRDQRGALVNQLKQDDFILIEEGKPQTIRNFARETDLPLTVGLLVDTSNSQARLVEGERRAAAQFFSQVIRPRDAAFLMSFDAQTKLLMDRSSSTQSIKTGLEKLQEASPKLQRRGGTGRDSGTLLYDAIYRASQENLRKEPGRKAIVLITDGMDVGSRLKIGDAIDAAQKADTIVYSIYYADPKAHASVDWNNAPGRAALREMSEQTGGRFFRVAKKQPLKKIFDQIQEEMRSQYALAFVSTDDRKDGTYRRLEVFIRQPGLKAQARKGYYTARAANIP